MTAEPHVSSNGHKTEKEQEAPLPRRVLDDPKIQAQIAEAKERARKGGTGRGKTADDLLDLARAQRAVDTRS
jgi:hypothetical protein